MLAERSEAAAYACLIDGSQEGGYLTIAGSTALVATSPGKSTLLNRVIGLGLEVPISGQVLDTLHELYAPGNRPWTVELPPLCCTAEALALLKEKGYRRSPFGAAIFAVDCSQQDDAPPGVVVRRAKANEAKLCSDLQADVFGVEDSLRRALESASTKAPFRQWLALVDGQPAGSCLSFAIEQTAWFGWSATLATHRGRGVQTALLSACRREAAQAGCRWLTNETAMGSATLFDPSRRNMLRTGFTMLYARTGFLHMPTRATRPQTSSPA